MFSRQVISSGLLRTVANSLAPSRTCTTNTEPSRIEKTLNQVQLLGRVGAEPQKRGTGDHPVVIFSLATHSNYRYESGEFLQRTDWHKVCIFKPGLRDTVLNYMKKGQRVHVTGRITYGEMKGEDGAVKPVASIIADDVIFFSSS